MSLASHQLRTPLTAMRWSIGRIKKELDGSISARQEHLLGTAAAATIRMAKTIDTMLQIARIESAQMHVAEQKVVLHALLQHIVSTFHLEYANKQQTVKVECSPRLHWRTDPTILGEVLSNLVSNAIRYTNKGGLIRLHAQHKDGQLRIDVVDTGVGIPIHQRQFVFKKFFRGDNVVSFDTEGTGLGLYLAAIATDALGGKLSFDSAEGKGTTFTLCLPDHAKPGTVRRA